MEKFKISNDPKFEKKVRDVVGLYLNPPDRALVPCVDEKRQIQALDWTALLLPSRPGLPERQKHDYKRYGTTTLFAAFNILNGKVIGSCLPRHLERQFVRFLGQLEKEVTPDLEVHFILDNYSTHKSTAVQRWLKTKAAPLLLPFHAHQQFLAQSGGALVWSQHRQNDPSRDLSQCARVGTGHLPVAGHLKPPSQAFPLVGYGGHHSGQGGSL